MIDWRSESGRNNICKKWLIVQERAEFGVDPKADPRLAHISNYAEAVAFYNDDMGWFTEDARLPFEYAVRERVKELKEWRDYQYLWNGTGSDELIAWTLGQYYLGRKCGK